MFYVYRPLLEVKVIRFYSFLVVNYSFMFCDPINYLMEREIEWINSPMFSNVLLMEIVPCNNKCEKHPFDSLTFTG